MRGAGVGERAVALVRTAGHRLYRTSLRTMRPDLAYFPEAVITPDMVVGLSPAFPWGGGGMVVSSMMWMIVNVWEEKTNDER